MEDRSSLTPRDPDVRFRRDGFLSAGVAESADAQDLKSCTVKGVRVQVPPPAPKRWALKSLGPTRPYRFDSGLRHHQEE